ncbi:MAG: sugar phosphate isomerase/epimerase family protein, partial [Chloroflexota bacterium]
LFVWRANIMQVGANTLIWTLPFTNEDIALAAHVRELGFDVLEVVIGREPPQFDPQRLRAALDEQGLGRTLCGGLGVEMDISSADPAVRQRGLDHIHTALDTAKAIGATIFVGSIGPCIGRKGKMQGAAREEQFELTSRALREVVPHAEAVGVRLAVEVLNRFENNFLNTVDEGIRLVDMIGSPMVGLLLDTFHQNIEESSIPAAIRAAGKRTFAFHACENNRAAPGTGLVDWVGVRDALRDIQYPGPLVIESFNPDNEIVASRFNIYRRFAPTQDDLAREGVKFLKQLFA